MSVLLKLGAVNKWRHAGRGWRDSTFETLCTKAQVKQSFKGDRRGEENILICVTSIMDGPLPRCENSTIRKLTKVHGFFSMNLGSDTQPSMQNIITMIDATWGQCYECRYSHFSCSTFFALYWLVWKKLCMENGYTLFITLPSKFKCKIVYAFSFAVSTLKINYPRMESCFLLKFLWH